MPWLQLKLTTTRQQAGTLEDALLSVGAVSVTLEDDADQPILEPALGETPLWDRVRVTGLFDANIDTAAVSAELGMHLEDRKSTRLNSSHVAISYAVFCLKKKKMEL